jgi:phosphoglycolate phosphatase-like HAD superfamily hydrolase
MVYEVLETFGIDPGESVMVGDTEIDVETGKNAGLFTIKVDYKGTDGETKADAVVTSFPDILDYFS